MSTKKDMRRPDLGQPAPARDTGREMNADMPPPPPVVPFQEPPTKGDDAALTSTLSSTMPMAAIFTRNRYIGW